MRMEHVPVDPKLLAHDDKIPSQTQNQKSPSKTEQEQKTRAKPSRTRRPLAKPSRTSPSTSIKRTPEAKPKDDRSPKPSPSLSKSIGKRRRLCNSPNQKDETPASQASNDPLHNLDS